MENNNNVSNLPALNSMLKAESVQKKFEQMLNKEAAGFIASITSCVSNSALLQKAEPKSIILAASQAAALKLPIVPNLGYAAIIPYGKTAQFQIMRNGWVELCERTGLVQRIANEIVYEGQLVKKNKFTGEYVFDEDAKKSDKIIGYMAYMKLTNGFEKTVYWTVDECKAHGKRFSQTYKNNKGLWVDDFNSMSLKGLAIDTQIPTPNGFTTMGEINVGDKIYNALGEETVVIAKSNVKNIPCYEVQFQNGDTVIADEEHRWFVRAGNGNNHLKNEWSVLTTQELYIAKALGMSVVIPSKPVVEFGEKELPIDPYILGYWLGNGSKSAAVVCCDEDDSEEIISKFEKYYDVKTRKDPRSRGIVLNISSKTKSRRDGSSLKQRLKEIGVYGNKHIPEIYLRSSVQQRLQLVRGLCDSDGSIDTRRGRCVFTSTRQELTDGLYTILSSLGENVTHFNSIARGYGVTTSVFSAQWQPHFNPFSLKRKADRFKERKSNVNVSVKSVVKVDSVPTQCLAVDSGDAREENDLRKSFLFGDGFFVTHNTVLKNLIVKYAPKSIELQQAIAADQASFEGDIDNPTPIYVDNMKNEERTVEEYQEAEVVNTATTSEGQTEMFTQTITTENN